MKDRPGRATYGDLGFRAEELLLGYRVYLPKWHREEKDWEKVITATHSFHNPSHSLSVGSLKPDSRQWVAFLLFSAD